MSSILEDKPVEKAQPEKVYNYEEQKKVEDKNIMNYNIYNIGEIKKIGVVI